MTPNHNNLSDDQTRDEILPEVAGPAGNQSNSEEDDLFNIRDFLLLCIAGWRWFAISIIICLGLGVLYILKTPKTFTREASVLIKDDENETSSSISSTLSDIGLFQSSANVNNEKLAFESPALIADVISRLGLQTNYTYRHGLKTITLYGDSLPINVSFLSLLPDEAAFMEAKILSDGKIKLAGMKLNGETCDVDEMTVNLGDTIKTEIGTIVVNPGPDYDTAFTKTIKVTRYPMTKAIQIYKSKLTEDLANEKASVIDFAFKDVSIQRADDFLNTLIGIYNEKWVEDKNEMAVANSKFISDRLRVIEQELGNVDSNIADYKGEHLIPDVEAASTMYMENSNEFSKRQLEVSTQIAISKFILEYIKDPANKGHLLPSNSGIENEGIEFQIKEINTKQLERNELANSTGESNPLLQDLDNSLRSMRGALTTSLLNQERALRTQLNSLISGDKATNRKIASSPTQAKYLLSVERQQKVKEALYTFLLQKREENELSRAFTPYNTRIITPPMGTGPASPNSRNIILIAFALGLILPALAIFLNQGLNNRLRNRSDLDGVRTPLIGEIPEASNLTVRERFRRARRRWTETLRKTSHIEQPPTLLVHAHGRSIINESFRMIRANLEFMTHNDNKRVIMVTSFNPGSGKSFISLNLAATLALKDKKRKALIIDLDLRRASVSRTLPDHSRGIADYLSESTDDCDSLIQSTPSPGLFILPVGTIPPNPSELLYSERLKNLIDRYKEIYDYIFLDCPPAEIVADASIITPLADITIFVIRAGLLDRRMIPEIDRIYDSHRYKNFMLILNGTTAAATPYRHYAYKSYYTSSKETAVNTNISVKH